MEESKNQTIRTSDFQIAVILHVQGFPLVEISPVPNSRKAEFVFQEIGNSQQIIDDFWNRQLSIEPRKLFESQKELKQRLYSEIGVEQGRVEP